MEGILIFPISLDYLETERRKTGGMIVIFSMLKCRLPAGRNSSIKGADALYHSAQIARRPMSLSGSTGLLM